MSQNFTAEQFESSYEPKHLSQWEIPKKFRKFPRPPTVEGVTTIITDDSGRFLPDVEKPPFKEWSSYKGTWGRDFVQPGVLKDTEVQPGIWLVKANRGQWVEAMKVPKPK